MRSCVENENKKTNLDDTTKMPTDSTLKQYSMRMEKLKKAKVDYLDITKLMEFFTANKLGVSTQKVYLSAIKHSHKDEYPKPLQDKLNELYTAQNKRDMKQTLTDRQQEKFVKWKDILAVQKTMGEKLTTDMSADHMTDWEDYLIVSLYTLNAPVRADYGEMRVENRYDKRDTGNQLIWRKTKPVFVFRDYKTAKTYGEVHIPVSKPLQKVIADWFAYYNGEPPFLLGDAMNRTQFAIRVAKTFGKYTGKELGVSLLRHSYITHMYPKLKTLKQKQDVATRMLHSRDLQEKYISLEDMD